MICIIISIIIVYLLVPLCINKLLVYIVGIRVRNVNNILKLITIASTVIFMYNT